MELKSKILIAIIILVIALAAVGAYVYTNNNSDIVNTALNLTKQENTTDFIDVDNATNDTADNATVVGDNSPNNNTTDNNTADYKVYNPQTDSYVSVIGEKYDDEVNRWYTYDADGVRYYNTRIN